ncbi:FAD binding domain-containing protein [Actinoplanes sp. NPDC020271]|uniref:FAD binding domain-containing protein n=1 Tax=Actinoplanes sp. NPDC020271 TaxID=3363896 RepID=UPI0037B02EBA
MPEAFEYIAARSVGDVLDALADGRTSVLAGGQSLLVEPTLGSGPPCPEPPLRVVDINPIAGLDTLTEADGVLRVGPLVRHDAFEADVVGGALGDLMRLVVCHIGHPPVRARGTMLGSLAYAHPAAEWPVVAVALGAHLVLATTTGRRTVPAVSFYTGPFSTVRRPDELLIEAWLPVLPESTGAGYAEDRRTTIYPQAAALATLTVVDGVVTGAAIGLVNAGPCPVRARTAERELVGHPPSDTMINAAADCAAEADGRGQQAFRVLVRRALTQARNRVRTGVPAAEA